MARCGAFGLWRLGEHLKGLLKQGEPETWEIWESGGPKRKADLNLQTYTRSPERGLQKVHKPLGLVTPGMWGSGSSVELGFQKGNKI